jgi:hypothetical protein
MESSNWVRLRHDEACGLRRGAWYRVVRTQHDSVVVTVGPDELTVPRDILQFMMDRPAKWSVVERGQGSASLLAKWGKCYAVCPSCRQRQAPIGRPRILRCESCNGLFEIEWNHPFIVGHSRLSCST